jgi:hypothetical protein
MHWCHYWNGLVKPAQGTHKSVEKSIKITTSDRNKLEYIAELVVTAEWATNRVKLNQLDNNLVPEVLAINKFSIVLPEELSIMTTWHDIEYVIELYLELLLRIRDLIGWLLSN